MQLYFRSLFLIKITPSGITEGVFCENKSLFPVDTGASPFDKEDVKIG
jgi:hypothetical protein